jgi:hypothetical protein
MNRIVDCGSQPSATNGDKALSTRNFQNHQQQEVPAHGRPQPRSAVLREYPRPQGLKAAILLFYGLLDEQQRRLFAGLESIRVGHGGDTLLGDFLGLDVHTVARGPQQLLDRNVVGGRTRRAGGGRTPMFMGRHLKGGGLDGDGNGLSAAAG